MHTLSKMEYHCCSLETYKTMILANLITDFSVKVPAPFGEVLVFGTLGGVLARFLKSTCHGVTAESGLFQTGAGHVLCNLF